MPRDNGRSTKGRLREAGRERRAVLVGALILCLLGPANVGPAWASPPAQSQDRVVGPTPAANTPNITDGKVNTLAEIGSRIVVGGTFTSVRSAGSSTTLTRRFLLAFDSATGTIDTGFVPALDAAVQTLLPSADGTAVYVGGNLTTVNGVTSRRLTLVRLSDGARVTSFHTPAMTGIVNDLRLAGGRLFLAGSFTTLAGIDHAGLASLDRQRERWFPSSICRYRAITTLARRMLRWGSRASISHPTEPEWWPSETSHRSAAKAGTRS